MSQPAHLPAQAFLRVKVGDRPRRLHLQDLACYLRIPKRTAPHLPAFWNFSGSRISVLTDDASGQEETWGEKMEGEEEE